MEMTQISGNLGASPGVAGRAAEFAGAGLAVGRSVELAAPTAAAGRAAELAGSSMRLADLKTGVAARVVSVTAAHADAPADLGRRLAELGFLPGEKLRIVARGLMSREPIAVRIGTGTFALRLFEAACIRVCLEPPPR